MPAAQVFGSFPRLFFFKELATPDDLDAAIEVDPVVFATVDVKGSAGAFLYTKTPDAAPPAKLTSLLGPVELKATPLFPHPGKKLAKPVTLAELKVLRALVEDLRVSLKEISDATGLSQKVVKKTRGQLLARGLLQVQPIFQSARSSRILLFEVHVHSHDPAVLSRVRQALPRSMFVNQWEDSALILSCWAESIAEVFETEKALRAEPGVTEVRVKFHARTILATARLLSWIDAETSRLEARSRA